MAQLVFSGIQPTGTLHIGNYLGALRNWVALQAESPCIYSIVDYHALTSQATDPSLGPGQSLADRTLDAAIDILACGVDPERAILFVQSAVPEHTELCWILNTVTPMGELERMTQYKDKAQRQEENINVGLFDYPVLQAADILLYKATAVPVGHDQLQHLELARELARKFNAKYGETFPEPKALLSTTPKILGLDGSAKMNKSLNNTIGLREAPDEIRKRLRQAVTDPQRARRQDPGRPEVCNVYSLHGFFTEATRTEALGQGCRTAAIGCVDCKGELAENMVRHLEPIRQRAAELAAAPDRVRQILAAGATKARAIAQTTMKEVRERLGVIAP